jgi:hypothetical protein
MRLGTLLLAAAALTAPGLAATPLCAGDIEISDAHIMRVEKNGVLVMTDGRALKLEGIRLPAGTADRAPPAIAERAFVELETLAKGGRLDARAVWPKEDRYDRVRSEVFSPDGTWLQLDLLSKGLARVELSPDRGECNREFYSAEAEARKSGLGLWADPAYSQRVPDQLGGDTGTFQLVVGRVQSTLAVPDGSVILEFGGGRRDFVVRIGADDVKTFKRMGVDPLNYEGKLIRVRGVVLPGPAVTVGNPKQIELLQ